MSVRLHLVKILLQLVAPTFWFPIVPNCGSKIPKISPSKGTLKAGAVGKIRNFRQLFCYIPKKLLPARTHPTECSLWTTKVVDNKWTELRELSKIRLLLPGTLLTLSEFTVGFFRCC